MDPQQHGSGVGESADPDQGHATDRSRRKFLGVVGAASATATTVLAGASAATAATASTSASVAQTQAMILRIAQVGVIFPLRLPLSGQAGYEKGAMTVARSRAARPGLGKGGGLRPANGVRPTAARLRTAEHTMPADYLALARTAAKPLVAAGLLATGQAALLEGIGQQAATAAAPARAALLAAVTLSVRTVFPDASERTAATAAGWWLGAVEAMHRQGILRDALQRRGIR
jgi:hypothetical protein